MEIFTFIRGMQGQWQRLWCALLIAGVLVPDVAGRQHGERILLIPELRNGETLVYQTHARIDRHVETKSNVTTMLTPGETRQDLSSEVRLSVQDARLVDHKLVVAGETLLEPKGGTDVPENAALKPQKIKFVIGGDGAVTKADGLDDLDPQRALLWQFWTSQFALGWTLPSAGVKPGEKWRSDEPEKTPSPIANLVWEREFTYVQNDRCPILAGQQCAVFLISSTLKQRSSPATATPEDYAVRQLKTSGTAKGTNETVAYISLETGLLVRATEDLQQSMNVTIAKTDDSNGVHYDIQVTSHFDTELTP
jgi:hypothetical protein